ncbi:YbaN family protein [uncultured Cohaesibacter sp.]|uniref:YbaN family protein n=1 Tax=uncultured Cohaesibacter sp. TaxID=1002546 RepID=UPI0029C8EBC4|nr:YbaN family protein [uncultured Cohaesibacter sp.]
MDRLKRPFYLVFGLILCGIGVLGAFLPLLPSTIFFIMAVYFFSKSSPRLEAWVLDHPLFGPSVVAWNEHKAIPRKAKWLAFAGMALGFVMFVLFSRPGVWLLLGVAIFFIASALYVGTRPDGPAKDN